MACLSTAQAATTRSLDQFLQEANVAGFRILFSSALVRSYYHVTLEEDSAITLDRIKAALAAYDLELKQTSNESYLVIARGTAEQQPETRTYTASRGTIEEVVVNASSHQFKMDHIGNSLSFDQENLAKRATIANDALRVSTRLPGSANNGISSRSSVRGGRENEMLILFNGMRLYEPFHFHQFNQLFSVVDGRTIDTAKFLTGGFPATYGDRLSGVTELETITPGTTENYREVGVGLYNASYLQGFSTGQHQVIVSLRRSTVDLLLKAGEHDFGTPSFADMHLRYQFSLDDDSTIDTNILWFGDDLTLKNSSNTENATSSFSNLYAWLSYQHSSSNGNTSDTRIGFTAIKDDREGTVDKPGMVTGSLTDDQEFRVYSLEHTRVYQFNNSLLHLGASYRYLDAEYGFQSEVTIDPRFAGISNFSRPGMQQFDETETGQQVALYFSYKHRLLRELYLEAGTRLDAQDYISSGWSKQVTPRLGLLYYFPFNGELRIGLGKFSQAQGIHEMDVSEGIPFFQQPQKAKHYVVSYKHSWNQVDLNIEAYRKVTTDPGFYFENLTDPISIVPELQIDRTLVAPSQVTARGIEISVSGEWNSHEFWLNFTRAEVEEHINGNSVRRSSDQKHAVNLGWSKQYQNWLVTLESTYHSGWPTTALSLDESGRANPVTRNDRRLQHYLTADLKATKEWTFNKSKLRLELGVTNLLNRDNIIGAEYELSANKLKLSETSALPIAPFIDVFFRF